MNRLRKLLVVVLAASTVMPTGCQWGNHSNFKGETDKYFEALATSIEYPAESPCTLNNNDPSLASPPPVTLLDADHQEYWNLSLAEKTFERLRESDRLRLGMLRADSDRYPARYRAFVEAYLRALNGTRR